MTTKFIDFFLKAKPTIVNCNSFFRRLKVKIALQIYKQLEKKDNSDKTAHILKRNRLHLSGKKPQDFLRRKRHLFTSELPIGKYQ